MEKIEEITVASRCPSSNCQPWETLKKAEINGGTDNYVLVENGMVTIYIDVLGASLSVGTCALNDMRTSEFDDLVV